MLSPVLTRTTGLLSSEFIQDCLSYFYENMYPSMPILHKSQAQQCVLEMDFSVEAYCLVGALCAFMAIQPDFHTTALRNQSSNSSRVHGLSLLEEVLRTRRSYDHTENNSVRMVVTSFLVSTSYSSMMKHDAAWFHLREAITLSQLLGMQDESSYTWPDFESTMRRRMFWMLFMYERYLHRLFLSLIGLIG